MRIEQNGDVSWRQRWRDEWHRLSTLDWRRLELGEAGRWPVSLRLLVAILAFVLALTAMMVGCLHPLSQRLVERQRQERAVIGDFEDRAHELAELDQLKRLLVDLDQRVNERRRMLPDGADIPSLLEGIGLVAKRRAYRWKNSNSGRRAHWRSTLSGPLICGCVATTTPSGGSWRTLPTCPDW